MRYTKCGMFRLHGVKKHRVTWISKSSQVLTKAAGRARMWRVRKVHLHVCGSKCMAFPVSVLSHASMTPNFKYGKLLHVCNWLKQVPWQLHVKRPSYACFYTPTPTWTHYKSCLFRNSTDKAWTVALKSCLTLSIKWILSKGVQEKTFFFMWMAFLKASLHAKRYKQH